MEYYSAIKKEQNCVIGGDVAGPRLPYRLKSERKKQIMYINACIWNLET